MKFNNFSEKLKESINAPINRDPAFDLSDPNNIIKINADLARAPYIYRDLEAALISIRNRLSVSGLSFDPKLAVFNTVDMVGMHEIPLFQFGGIYGADTSGHIGSTSGKVPAYLLFKYVRNSITSEYEVLAKVVQR